MPAAGRGAATASRGDGPSWPESRADTSYAPNAARMPARLSIARWRSASPSGCSLYRASSNRDVRVSDATRETWSRSTARPSSSLGVRAPWAVIPRAPSSAQNRRKHARITDRTSPPTSSPSIASCTASAAAWRAAGSSPGGSASISTTPAPRRSRTTKMTMVERTVNPRNKPRGAPAATGHPEPLEAPASPVVGAVWPTRSVWSIWGHASRRAMIRMRPIAEETTCHQENGFVGTFWRTRRRRNAWTRIATTKLTKTTRNRSPTSGSKTPNAFGSVPPEAPPPGIASPPVSRFATLKASAATSRIARNRSSGTAHSAFPRHVRITSVRRRRGIVHRGGCQTAVAGRNHQERADRGEGHRETEHERDRDALRMQDLAALVREFVVDPLPSFVHALHEARGLELLEVLEKRRFAQAEEVAQVRDRLAPHVESLQDPDADVRGERLEARLVQRDLRAAARLHGPESDATAGT